MNCPHCGHTRTKVTDSRDWDQAIRRRRQCLACDQRYTTLERAELGALLVVKKNGNRQEFDREKVLIGVRKACQKRPIPSDRMEALIDSVEQAVQAQGKTEVPVSLIGELVMGQLRELDHLAYLRFASVYRSFSTVDDLKNELAALEEGWQRPDVPEQQMPLLPDSGLRRGQAKLLRVRRATHSREIPQVRS